MRLCKDCCDSTIRNCYLCAIGQAIIFNTPNNRKTKAASAQCRNGDKSTSRRRQKLGG